MPKKSSKKQHKASAKRSKNNHYFDHDDRDGRRADNDSHFNGFNGRPRVSFKSVNKSNKKGITNVGLAALKSCLDDDDVAMVPVANGNNATRIIGSRGKGRGGYVNNRRRVDPPLREGYCYKIHIYFGKKLDKETLIGLLLNPIQPDVFMPIMYQECEHDVIFYIDDFKVAKKLLSLDRKILTPDGFKIHFQVTQQSPPSKINEDVINKIKLAMNKRYVANENSLDLSAFHNDCDLASEYYLPLHRNNVLIEVLDIIGATGNISETLNALYLNRNHFESIHKLSILRSKCPNLKILHICDNKITLLNQLEAVRGLRLVELNLTGNPVCMRYENRHEKYDDINLLPPILFEVDDEAQCPITIRSFDVSCEPYKTANEFLIEYIKYFDSESRQTLADAYDENAVFSITLSSPPSQMYKFDIYRKDNRDLMRTKNVIERRSLLKHGKASIISYISSLPQTTHCLSNYILDATLVTENRIAMTTTGFFKELNTKNEIIRCFDRIFIIVREGAGWYITNDQLSLSQPTPKQEKNISKLIVNEETQRQQQQQLLLQQQQQEQLQQQQQLQELQQQLEQQLQLQEPTSSTSTTIVEPSRDLLMIHKLSEETNMKLEWSEQCLAEYCWNFDNALASFKYLFEHGKIPQEAFQLV
ncbi:hypothetical protein HCN44_011390 [Aphidius gifuensis]|uniref:Nuclear RNA export factor 1-like n=1 Tax=Aphidius gifuensis TaxID=684658 RepID=A0A834XWL3_APHGI|nr:hypothetical protein HCN44_011390 [Aphidius gifuensis]